MLSSAFCQHAVWHDKNLERRMKTQERAEPPSLHLNILAIS